MPPQVTEGSRHVRGSRRLLTNPHLLVQPYLATQALTSSRIEGTQASLSDVFEAAADDRQADSIDVREVQNYVAAFELGRRLLDELPLSLRLVRKVHERLLTGVRGEERNPGEFRTSQNWIGRPGGGLADAVFVPPRHDPERREALADWEQFLHERTACCRRWWCARCCTISSRRSTRSSTATAGSAGWW